MTARWRQTPYFLSRHLLLHGSLVQNLSLPQTLPQPPSCPQRKQGTLPSSLSLAVDWLCDRQQIFTSRSLILLIHKIGLSHGNRLVKTLAITGATAVATGGSGDDAFSGNEFFWWDWPPPHTAANSGTLHIHRWAPSVPMHGSFPGLGHLTGLFLHPC